MTLDREGGAAPALVADPGRINEWGVQALLAGAVVALCWQVSLSRPVAYMGLIAEDRFGEYATAIGYFVMAGFFMLLAWRSQESVRRFVWVLVAAAGAFVGGEEISWGQRILGIGTPDAIREINLQGELTVHNMMLSGDSHTPAAFVLLVGVIFSQLLLSAGGSAGVLLLLRTGCDRLGLPLVPRALGVWFIAVAGLFYFVPLVKSDEIGEFVLGLAAALFGLYSWFRFRTSSPPGSSTRMLASVVVIAFVAVGALAVERFGFAGGIGDRLRKSAVRDYPAYGQYEQADVLFRFMEENPRYLNVDTRIQHAASLVERGRRADAERVLNDALKVLQAPDQPRDAAHLRAEAGIWRIRGTESRVAELLHRAVVLDRAALASATGYARADRYWSLAQTFADLGDDAAATEHANLALRAGPLGTTRKKIEIWMRAESEGEE